MNRFKKNPRVLLGASAVMAVLMTALLAGPLAIGLLWAGASDAQAQTQVAPGIRQFPRGVLRGQMMVTAPPDIRLDGQPDRLSPGSRIRAPSNVLVMSSAIVGQPLVVNYLRDSAGLVHEVWILNEAEARLRLPTMKPERNFFFSSEADNRPVDDGKTPFHMLPKYGQ